MLWGLSSYLLLSSRNHLLLYVDGEKMRKLWIQIFITYLRKSKLPHTKRDLYAYANN